MAVAARAQRAYELYDGTLHEVDDPSSLTHRAEAGHASDEAGAEQVGTEPAVAEPPLPPAENDPEAEQASAPATSEEGEQ